MNSNAIAGNVVQLSQFVSFSTVVIRADAKTSIVHFFPPSSSTSTWTLWKAVINFETTKMCFFFVIFSLSHFHLHRKQSRDWKPRCSMCLYFNEHKKGKKLVIDNRKCVIESDNSEKSSKIKTKFNHKPLEHFHNLLIRYRNNLSPQPWPVIHLSDGLPCYRKEPLNYMLPMTNFDTSTNCDTSKSIIILVKLILKRRNL